MSANHSNTVTGAIDAQLVFAPQYGIFGAPSKFDPPVQFRVPRLSSNHKGQAGRCQFLVRQERTKDLKVYIAILQEELGLVDTGKLQVKQSVKQAMEERLRLMIAEKTRRDLRDLAAGKTAPSQSFYSIGARYHRAA